MSKFRFMFMESDDPKAVAELAGVIAREFRTEANGAALETTAPALVADVATAALPSPYPPKQTRKTKRRQHIPIPKRKSTATIDKPNRQPSGGNDPRARAEAVLRKAGKPISRAECARRAGIKPGSTTAIFRDPRFTITHDHLLWLAEVEDPRGEEEGGGDADDEEEDEQESPDDEQTTEDADDFEDPPPPPANLSRRANRTDTPTVDELKKAIKSCGPMNLAELARFTECSEANCYGPLQGNEFEKIDGLYWIAK